MEFTKPPSSLPSLPSFNSVFTEHILYAKHCSRFVPRPLYALSSQTALEMSPLPAQFCSPPVFQVRGVTIYLIALVLCLVLLSSSALHPSNWHFCYLIPGSPCLDIPFLPAFLPLLSPTPGERAHTRVG